MAEDPKPEGKKVHPAMLAGPTVVIGAALLAVFIATRNTDKPADPAAAPVETADANSPIAQPASASVFGQDDPAQPTTPAPPADTATAVSPDGASVSFTDESLTFSAAIPPGPADDPILAALRKDAQNYLASKKTEARTAFDEFKKAGSGSPAWPWEVMINWEYTAKAGDIVSLFGSSYEFAGGAHGMTLFDTHIARTNGQQLKFADMLQGGLSPAVVIAVCEALKVEKQKRTGSQTIYDEPITCAGPNANVKIDEAKFALAPSDQQNKFGGAYVYYEPYRVGPYVEGSYTVGIQQEVFAQDVRAEFKTLFAGTAPAPKD